MTRAKDNLHLIIPQRFYAHAQRGDRHMYAVRTRFIPDGILDKFESCARPVATAESANREFLPREQVDIGAHLRRRWS
jgi:DNA helicase-2/ATP-dependent DNA helicase PcrA